MKKNQLIFTFIVLCISPFTYTMEDFVGSEQKVQSQEDIIFEALNKKDYKKVLELLNDSINITVEKDGNYMLSDLLRQGPYTGHHAEITHRLLDHPQGNTLINKKGILPKTKTSVTCLQLVLMSYIDIESLKQEGNAIEVMDIMETLIQKGENPTLSNEEGQSPIDYANQTKRSDVAQFMRDFYNEKHPTNPLPMPSLPKKKKKRHCNIV